MAQAPDQLTKAGELKNRDRDYTATRILLDGTHLPTDKPNFRLPVLPGIKRVDDRPHELRTDPKGVTFDFQSDVNDLAAVIVPYCAQKDGSPVSENKEYSTIDPIVFGVCERVDKKDNKLKILMVHEVDRRDNTPRGLFLPAGKIEPGETVSAALIREGVEETGLLLKPVGLFNIVFGGASYDGFYDKKAPVHFLVACAQASKALKVTGDSESSGAAWFDLDEVIEDVKTATEKAHPTRPDSVQYFGGVTQRQYRKPWELRGVLQSYRDFKEKYNDSWIPLTSADICHFNIHRDIGTMYDK